MHQSDCDSLDDVWDCSNEDEIGRQEDGGQRSKGRGQKSLLSVKVTTFDPPMERTPHLILAAACLALFTHLATTHPEREQDKAGNSAWPGNNL